MSEVNNVYKNKIFYKIKLLLGKYPYAPAFLHKERCQPLSCQRHLAEAVSLWWTGMLCSVFWGSTIPCCAVRLCASFLFTGYRDILSSLFSSYTQHTCTVPAAGRLPQDCPGRPPTPSKCPVSQTRRCIRGRQTQVFPSPPLVSASMASDAPPGYPNAFFQLMSFASHPDCPEGCPPILSPLLMLQRAQWSRVRNVISKDTLRHFLQNQDKSHGVGGVGECRGKAFLRFVISRSSVQSDRRLQNFCRPRAVSAVWGCAFLGLWYTLPTMRKR